MENAGATFRVFDPIETAILDRVGSTRLKTVVEVRGGSLDFVNDPKLASWLLGADLVAAHGRGLSRFAIVSMNKTAAIAWESDRSLVANEVARISRLAEPLASKRVDAEHFIVFAPARRRTIEAADCDRAAFRRSLASDLGRRDRKNRRGRCLPTPQRLARSLFAKREVGRTSSGISRSNDSVWLGYFTARLVHLARRGRRDRSGIQASEVIEGYNK